MNLKIRTLSFLVAACLAVGIVLLLADKAPSTSNDAIAAGIAAAPVEVTDGDETVAAANDTPGDNQEEVVKTEPKEEKYETKTNRELHKVLTPIQFDVTQNEATEPAFRNRYWNNKLDGTYTCIVCDLDLFPSETKYKSGTGWPSFYAPIDAKNVGLRKDWRLIYARTEVHCSRCNAHLGHVFDDGPQPTGKRYCMNSASMKFVEKKNLPDAKVEGKQSE
jgi:peptide-methionine (R)-S-oxide reductase